MDKDFYEKTRCIQTIFIFGRHIWIIGAKWFCCTSKLLNYFDKGINVRFITGKLHATYKKTYHLSQNILITIIFFKKCTSYRNMATDPKHSLLLKQWLQS